LMKHVFHRGCAHHGLSSPRLHVRLIMRMMLLLSMSLPLKELR
jgi:hypothetical protein